MKISNETKDKAKKIVSSRKFKYGSSAVVFTAVFVAFVILFNVLLTFIDARTGGLYADMTSKRLYGVSEASKEALKGIDKQIEIIFCQPSDKVAEYDILNPIKMLAESYEKEFKNVKVIYKDRLSDPVYFNSFIKTSADQISTSSIIVNCPTTGLSTIYSWENMYKYNTDGELFAFDGENKLTTAILSLARSNDNMLKAGIVTGHGETAGHEVQHYLEDYGYAVSYVDLKTISGQELATYKILLVCNPTSDYIGMDESELVKAEDETQKTPSVEETPAQTEETSEETAEITDGTEALAETENSVEEADETESSEQEDTEVLAGEVTEASDVQEETEAQVVEPEETITEQAPVYKIETYNVNEIEKLYNYVVEDFGNIMFFFDPSGKQLPELYSLVSDGFGVEFYNDIGYVFDPETALVSNMGYDVSSLRFIGTYDVLDTSSFGYKLHKSISEAQAGYPPAFGVSSYINIPKSTVGSFEISPIITGSENTIISGAGASGEAVAGSVPYAPLMTLSKYLKIVDNKEVSANVIVCGSTGFINELDNQSFANADLFKQILISTGNDNIVADIDYKVLDESSIEVTGAQSKTMMIRLAVLIPVIIAIVGAVVFIKRKYL